jgi:hypothetical protein
MEWDTPLPPPLSREEEIARGRWLAERYRRYTETDRFGGMLIQQDDGVLRPIGMVEAMCLEKYQNSRSSVERWIEQFEQWDGAPSAA